MRMKRQFYLPLLITLLASLVFGVLPLVQPTQVYAAPDTVTIRPNAAGDEASLTIGGTTPAATNWESVDDDPTDDDVTYVEDGSQAIVTDLYNLAGTALSGTINSVTVYVHVKGTKAGAGPVTRIKTNGVAYNGNEITVTTSYATSSTTYNTNPQTAAAWTWEEVNALQAGVGLKKPAGGATSRCTQVWVVVDYTLPPSISNTSATGNSYGFGTIAEGSTTGTGLSYFTVTNNSAFNVNITISAGNMTGGITWTLADNPAADIYALRAGTPGAGDYTTTVTSGGTLFISDLAGLGSTQDWGLQLLAPTSFSDGGSKSGTVTLTATQA